MAEMKFEEALKKLEKIVGELEGGDLPLDEALEKYEEGIRLSKTCAKKLEAAKKKVEMLIKNEDGSVEIREFDEKAAREDEKPQGEPRSNPKARLPRRQE
ncbi:MAG: exodeoxyribonuclease VII small subunit [Candidatus Omnitrophica bacterium]|nr:exodeoxyribonuclease VII small subunit [Candidatus Omnitrophota bacterium]